MNKGKNYLIYFTIFILSLLWVLPIIVSLLISFSPGLKWPEVIFNIINLRAWKYIFIDNTKTLKAILTSIEIAFIVTIINLVLAIPSADALGRYNFKGKKLVEIILFLPIIVPPIVIMMGLHKTFIKLGLTESYFGVILSHIIPTLPYMIRAINISFSNLGFKFEQQAKMLGASRFNRFRYIILPFILPGIVVGSSLTILISLSQYIVTLFIGGGQVVTLSVLMFPFINGGDESIGAAYSILFAIVALISLIISDYFLKIYYENKKIF